MLGTQRIADFKYVLVAVSLLAAVCVIGCGGGSDTAEEAPEAASQVAAGDFIEGTVKETMDSGGYTYVLVESADGPVWAAGPTTTISVGDAVRFTTSMAMPQFRSETLDRTFELIYFVPSFGGETSGTVGGPNMADALKQMHGGKDVMGGVDEPSPAGGAKTVLNKEISGEIERAPGGLSIAEVYTERAELKGQSVTVRGVVVKFNGGIMGTNWIHIQDGTCADDFCDLAVTTNETFEEGAVVTLQGVLAVDKDFGAGYRYEVIVQGAKQVSDS